MSHIGYDIPTSSVWISGGDLQGCAHGYPLLQIGERLREYIYHARRRHRPSDLAWVKKKYICYQLKMLN